MAQGNNENNRNDNRGLASVDEETREWVARAGMEATPMIKEDYK